MLRPKKPFKNTTKWAAEFVCVFFGAGMRRKLCELLPVPMRYLITNFMMPDGVKQVTKQYRPGGLRQGDNYCKSSISLCYIKSFDAMVLISTFTISAFTCF